ncbi:MAG: aminopeptidase P family protein, partial [Anaerolineales bacterium]|nr:aminopeptidase P family protein [Anaerolineales bacterium]
MHLEQRQRAHAWLRQHGFDCALFSAPASVAWLTGLAPAVQTGPSPFAGGPPLVWYAGGDFSLIVPDSLAAEAGRPGLPVLTYAAYAYQTPVTAVQQLAARVRALTENARGQLGAEQQSLPAHLWPAGALGLDGRLDDLRLVKTDEELAFLRRNFALTDAGHAAGRRAVQIGLREIDVWTAVQSAIEQAAGGRVVLGNDCVAGYRENNVGGWPGDLPLRPGDSLILDLSTRVDGYWSDSCGTYYAGGPSERQAAVHRTVQAALELA